MSLQKLLALVHSVLFPDIQGIYKTVAMYVTEQSICPGADLLQTELFPNCQLISINCNVINPRYILHCIAFHVPIYPSSLVYILPPANKLLTDITCEKL